MKEHLWASVVAISVVCSAAVPPRAQAPPAPAGQPPTPAVQAPAQEEALAWDRDFDLLLELKAAPTKAQRDAESRRIALGKERADLAEHLEDLRARLAAVEGTYTSEAILDEMIKQGVSDMQSAQDNLRKWVRQDEERIKEIDATLLKMTAQTGD